MREQSLSGVYMVTRHVQSSATLLALAAAGLSALYAARGSAAGVPSTPDVARGEHIAGLVCAACHVVAVDQEYPPILNQQTPSFADIANRPGISARYLERFITTTHWDIDKLPMSMPNPQLSKAETAAVSLYILSLRNR
jgi:mono/diheme cytochrome c family protein